ncbi:MAG: hypothetical protein LBF58_07900 [Deltaproteobacteria bacterium]|jgi:hypothetical protein|nr:hypothetical protein [Deltaproteobacteria bacterium]
MFVHGANIVQKISDKIYKDKESIKFLNEINKTYKLWKGDNLKILGPFIEINKNDILILEQRVSLLNNYKDFIDQQKYAEKFDSRSNLHSKVRQRESEHHILY